MPRDLPVGNGRLLVTFDALYRIRDFYFPHVGQENHAGKQPFLFGVWADGADGAPHRLHWVHEEGWTRSLDYEDDTLVGRALLRNEGLGLELQCADVVDFHLNVYLRHVVVRNLLDAPRALKLYFHHAFCILGNSVGDTAYFDPATRCLIHYKGARYFLINCCGPNACGIESFATGTCGGAGLEGTFRDAEDGALSGNPIAQGSVDSILEIKVDLDAKGEASSHYWIIAGTNYDEVSEIDRLVLSRSPDELIRRTRDYWLCWANKEDYGLDALPPPVARHFKRSLLILTTQIDSEGAVLAANDTDYLHFSSDTYSYCWPRDGALTCHALDLAGHGAQARRFFEFCARVIRHEGYLLHKYNPDGTVASSWLPWTSTVSRLPIQEDESALVVWALWQHYLKFRDIDFIRTLYRPLVISIGDFLARYRDTATGLPLPSWDLWEERCGVHAYTCGAVHGGLTAAHHFAATFGQTEKAELYGQAMTELRRGIDEHLYCPAQRRFYRALVPADGGWQRDATLDSSICGLWLFGAYPPNDPRVLETARQLREGLTVRTEMGGVARYENDRYFRSSSVEGRVPGNPWFICTLWDALLRVPLCESEKDLEAEALPLLLWAVRHARPSGVMSEQIHPETGEPLSVSPLTWSHATFVECVMRYLERLGELRRCPTCGSPRRARP
jgi:GH15 family glucan-1,4-alpha-glucosidase